MKDIGIFVSVGGTATEKQENFVKAVEDRLRSEFLVPRTIGRNTFSSDAPLKSVKDLMDQCFGTVVIAFERTYLADGADKRGGPKQSSLKNIKLPTAWNQVEAAMAHSRGHPLLMIVERDLKNEGLIDRGHEWYIQWVEIDPSALNSHEFNGVFSDWKKRVANRATAASTSKSLNADLSDLTIGQLLKLLKPSHLWTGLSFIGTLIAGAFALGAKLFG